MQPSRSREGNCILLRGWIVLHHFADRPRFLLLPSAAVLALVSWAEVARALLTHTGGAGFSRELLWWVRQEQTELQECVWKVGEGPPDSQDHMGRKETLLPLKQQKLRYTHIVLLARPCGFASLFERLERQ